ncbi:unnamed protein product [Diatraea saccharalis]|uniref:C2H2-type domain-containing protein n=1 Tax=Diatraea saccharalis TaxID=40085 RepID=A0A9N9MZE6_9NEOP|nr:unnamed protein product [Diatraea saccharalis]
MRMVEPNGISSGCQDGLSETISSRNMVNDSSMKNVLFFDEEQTAKFTCTECKKYFYNAVALQNHIKMQHDASDRKCVESQKRYVEENFKDLCGFKFIPLPDNESKNIGTHTGVTSRIFTEDTTYLIVKVEGIDMEMEALKKAHHNGNKKNNIRPIKPPVDLRGPFTCTFRSILRPDLQCRQIFFNCCDYSTHYREEHTKRRNAALRCQVCEKRLDNDNDNIQSNTIAAQFQPVSHYTFSCRICGQTFLDSAQFDEHNRIVHAKSKPHQCTICAKRFTQQGGLQQHMRMHTGIRPFVCTYCPKAFTQKAGLDQHLRTHTKIKPFKCVICSKCFSQSVHLRQHMRTHTNIQPFECSVCGRRFKQSSHLNFHTRSHVVGASSLDIEKYAQAMPHQNQMEFLNLSNLQPVQDGETLYYAAELAEPMPINHIQDPFSYQPQVMLPEHMLSI